MSYNLFRKMSRYGVVSRSDTKNDLPALHYFLKNNVARRVVQKRRVFYELTEKALPLLEKRRQVLLHEASLLKQLIPHGKVYRALLEDLRFLDEKNPQAEYFRLLGDWHLLRPVVSSQLALAQLRYYQALGFSSR